MRVTFILAAIAAASTVSAYQCPALDQVNMACRSIGVSPCKDSLPAPPSCSHLQDGFVRTVVLMQRRVFFSFPIAVVCNNPNVNRDACNAKQCNQTYINNYSDCQCRRDSTNFYQVTGNGNRKKKVLSGFLSRPRLFRVRHATI